MRSSRLQKFARMHRTATEDTPSPKKIQRHFPYYKQSVNLQVWNIHAFRTERLQLTEQLFAATVPLRKKLAYTPVYTCTHQYVSNRTHVRGCVRFHLYARSKARVRRKVERISRLHRHQIRYQCLLLCYLQGQSKANAVTIAKRRLQPKRKLIAY